jgi:hypothetical protein
MQHALVGQKVINGSGVGSVSIAYQDNNTESDLGADGNVMVSEVLSHRGTISLELQQASSANKWLHNLANVLDNSDPNQFLGISIRITEKFDNGMTTTATRASIQKRPDRKDESNGGRVTWVFFCPNIETM